MIVLLLNGTIVHRVSIIEKRTYIKVGSIL